MEKIFAFGLLALLASSAIAQVHVNGYYRKNGTYVQPHMRSSPDNTTLNNYSTKGNINPYTGEPGTRNPDPQNYGVQPTRQIRQAEQIQPLQPPQPTMQLQPLQPLKPLQPLQPLKPFGQF